MSDVPSLERLQAVARAYGVGTEFYGFYGDLIEVGALTLTRVLQALGVPASTPQECDAALAAAQDGPWRRMLPATVVVRAGQSVSFPVHVPHGQWTDVWIVDEWGHGWPAHQGDQWTEPREVDGVLTGRATYWTPPELPLGWHTIRGRTEGQESEATLIVVPERVTTGDDLPARTGKDRTWGLMAQLYSVRGSRSWGIGDLADLSDLATIGAAAGAQWVLVNPMHAAEPTPPMAPSPYLPTTRRFFSPIYLRIEDIPELAHLPSKQRKRIHQLATKLARANTRADELPRDAAFAAKLEALRLLADVPRSPTRERQFEAFRAWHGQGLTDFALWCAIRERADVDAEIWDDVAPGSPKAAELAERLARDVEFHVWIQWLIDEQLEAAQRACRQAGMGVGIVHDLAVGVHPAGADSWALAHVLVRGAEVGAPPDMYNQQGQNWSQPPWHPHRLAEAGYRPFRDMLRTILRHAGGIRVDHVLGLFRLWWVPTGMRADAGTYVTYDHEALVGILSLEAQRAGAVVVGEDLGTFEPWVREFLSARGLLGTSILWFEYAGDKSPMPPEDYRRHCLASVNTHDLPPTAGYLAGEHIELRERLGLLTRPVQTERAEDEAERERVLDLARRRGLLPADADESVTVASLYRLLGAAPALMHGVALVDAVGERRVQNQPGTDQEYPNWTVPLADSHGNAVLVEELSTHPRAQALFEAVRETLG